MSKLLINEYPLQVLPSLATVIGLNEAIVVQQIHYWLVINEQHGEEMHYHDGRWWVWNTTEGWQTNFPFWSGKTIERALTSLRNPITEGKYQRGPLIITGRYNKKGYDRTLWYTIDYDELDKVEKQYLMSKSSRQNGEMEKDNLSRPIPETTPETTTNTVPPSNLGKKGDFNSDPPDLFALALKTERAQQKLKLPVTYLADFVSSALGYPKRPNHRYESDWENPLSDLLDQADHDVDKVERALTTALAKAREGKLTVTTPTSLHGLALEALASGNGSESLEERIARERAREVEIEQELVRRRKK